MTEAPSSGKPPARPGAAPAPEPADPNAGPAAGDTPEPGPVAAQDKPGLTAEKVSSGEAFWKAAGVFHRLR